MKKRKIVALVCVATVLLLAVSAFWYVQTKLDKINKVPDTVEFEGETYPVVKVEISSSSHPFYTGKSKLVDTAGRVDRFMNRYGKLKK